MFNFDNERRINELLEEGNSLANTGLSDKEITEALSQRLRAPERKVSYKRMKNGKVHISLTTK